MRLSAISLVPAFIAAASAAADASVYLFQGDDSSTISNHPVLTPEQARLIFAQRIGASQYHGVGDVDDNTLSYVNQFGVQRELLFEETDGAKAAELVIIVDGVSPKTAKSLLSEWSSIEPAFKISSPPSMAANLQLCADLSRQVRQGRECTLEDAINPFEADCWSDNRSKILHFDLGTSVSQLREFMEAQASFVQLSKNGAMNVLLVLMPESTRLSKSAKTPYGIYQTVSQPHIGRRQSEEPITDSLADANSQGKSKPLQISNSSSNGTFEPIRGVPKLCHDSFEKCMKSTNKCSGHGNCYKKRGTVGKSACFTCGCKPSNETFLHGDKENPRKGFKITYYGGAACQKEDVSGPFWLIAIFTIVMIGLVSWAIGMIFSIGEEKLPGVIGAGVSGNKAR